MLRLEAARAPPQASFGTSKRTDFSDDEASLDVAYATIVVNFFTSECLDGTARINWLRANGIKITHPDIGQQKPCSPKTHAKSPVVTAITYYAARKALLTGGPASLRTKSRNTAKDDPDIAHGNGRVFSSGGYFKVESCSGTGVAGCAFLFKGAYGNCLGVATAGMAEPKEKVFAS